jgi:hypothetical protein
VGIVVQTDAKIVRIRPRPLKETADCVQTLKENIGCKIHFEN